MLQYFPVFVLLGQSFKGGCPKESLFAHKKEDASLGSHAVASQRGDNPSTQSYHKKEQGHGNRSTLSPTAAFVNGNSAADTVTLWLLWFNMTEFL